MNTEIAEVIAPLPLLINIEEKAEKAKANVDENFKAFADALHEINEKKLYRGEYATFAAYVSGRWGIHRSRAYQIIDARETFKLLSNTVDIPSERAALGFSGLTDDEKIKAAKALKKSGQPVTSKTVKAAALKVSPKKQSAEKKRQERDDAKAKKRADAALKKEQKEQEKREAKAVKDSEKRKPEPIPQKPTPKAKVGKLCAHCIEVMQEWENGFRGKWTVYSYPSPTQIVSKLITERS